jgi:glycosyltransferase involved in cell wall biosynthesis
VLEDAGVDVRVVPRRFRFDITPAARLWHIAFAIGPDIVHSWDWMSTVAMIPFCRARKVPLLDGAIRRGFLRPRRSLIDRMGVSLADAVVANSRAGLAAYGIVEGARASVVYNAFDPVRLENIELPIRDVASGSGVVAIMAARMVRDKDWRLFLAAARALSRDVRGWEFVAVGVGSERDALMAEADDLIGAGVVRFPAGGPEVLPIVAAADIGVLLTDARTAAEGCSNSIMEYMACSLPVICTDSGGNRELVEDEVTGLLVPPGDVDALVSALRALGRDATRAREMGREARRRIETCFTIDAMVSGFVASYESALGAPAVPLLKRAESAEHPAGHPSKSIARR